MSNRLAMGLVALALVAAPRLAAAFVQIQLVFDTVDSVEIKSENVCSGCQLRNVVIVRGIPAGSTTPGTFTFDFDHNADIAAHCQRQATIAMSKPGKYQFAIGAETFSGQGTCKLIRIPL